MDTSWLQKLATALTNYGSSGASNGTTNGPASYGANTGAFGSANMFNQPPVTNSPFWTHQMPQTQMPANPWGSNPQAYQGQPQGMANNMPQLPQQQPSSMMQSPFLKQMPGGYQQDISGGGWNQNS